MKRQSGRTVPNKKTTTTKPARIRKESEMPHTSSRRQQRRTVIQMSGTCGAVGIVKKRQREEKETTGQNTEKTVAESQEC